MKRIQLINHLTQLLQPDQFQDYCPNGLHVAGSDTIKKMITGVTASQDLIDAAIHKNADTILVHHGYFWKGENPCVVGIKRKRLAALLANDINLLAYHLPLDAHPVYGNNVQLARYLSFTISDIFNNGLLYIGELAKQQSAIELQKNIQQKLHREPQMLIGHQRDIKTIAWCTGAAQDLIEQAAELKIDAFLSGEVSERTFYQAKELGITYFAAGHHATERYGIQALGEHLQQEFQLNVEFIDIDNPV